MNKPLTREHAGSWSWILQALTGALLVMLLGMHIVVQHFVVAGGLLNALGSWALLAAMKNGGKAVIVVPMTAVYPLLVCLMAPLLLNEHLTAIQGAGVTLALAAIVLLAGAGIADGALRNRDARAPIRHLRGELIQGQAGRFAVELAHGILGLVDIPDDSGQGAVVTDGSGQNIGNAAFLAGIDDAVLYPQLINRLPHGTLPADPVQDIEMMVVP